MSGTWTACRRATADVSGSICGIPAAGSERAAGCCHASGRPPCPPHWTRLWPPIAGVPGPCPAARHESCHAAGRPQGPSRVHSGGRRADVGRTSVRSVRSPRTPAWSPTPAWPYVPDTARPDGGHPGSSGRSIGDRSGSLQLPLLSSRPTCGRPPPAAVLGRQQHWHHRRVDPPSDRT